VELHLDHETRREYRRVLEEELADLFRLLGGEAPSQGLTLPLEDLARHLGRLGLSLWVEARDERGEVLARFTLSPEEARVL